METGKVSGGPSQVQIMPFVASYMACMAGLRITWLHAGCQNGHEHCL